MEGNPDLEHVNKIINGELDGLIGERQSKILQRLGGENMSHLSKLQINTSLAPSRGKSFAK